MVTNVIHYTLSAVCSAPGCSATVALNGGLGPPDETHATPYCYLVVRCERGHEWRQEWLPGQPPPPEAMGFIAALEERNG